MRDLNNIEKGIITELAQSGFEPKFVSDFIVEVLEDCLLHIDRDKDKLDIVIFDIWENQSGKNDELIDKAIDSTSKIITVINFINYLESNGYILTGYFSHGIPVDPTYGNKENLEKYNQPGNKKINWPFTDKIIKQLILKNIDLNIIPTEALRQFFKNKFRNKNEIRHFQNIRIAWIAITISLALGISGIILNIFPSTSEIKIDSTQFNEITNQIKILVEQIDSLNLMEIQESEKPKTDSLTYGKKQY